MARVEAKARTDILAEHFSELAWLWERREAMLFSPAFGPGALAAHDRRMEGHVRGLVVAGEDAVPVLAAAIESDDPATAAAAAYVLLRRGTLAGDRAVLRALTGAEGARLDAIRRAVCMAPIDAIAPELGDLLATGPAPAAAAAAEALAFHGRLDAAAPRLARLRADEDPAVRRAAWRAVALSGAAPVAGGS